MNIQTPQFIIPAKAGNQEKVEKKRPSHINWEKTVLFQKTGWVPAFAGMTQWVKLMYMSYIKLGLFNFLNQVMIGYQK